MSTNKEEEQEEHQSHFHFEEMLHKFFNIFNWETVVVVALGLCALSMYMHGVYTDATFYLLLIITITIGVSWIYWKCVARPSQYYALPSQLPPSGYEYGAEEERQVRTTSDILDVSSYQAQPAFGNRGSISRS